MCGCSVQGAGGECTAEEEGDWGPLVGRNQKKRTEKTKDMERLKERKKHNQMGHDNCNS